MACTHKQQVYIEMLLKKKDWSLSSVIDETMVKQIGAPSGLIGKFIYQWLDVLSVSRGSELIEFLKENSQPKPFPISEEVKTENYKICKAVQDIGPRVSSVQLYNHFQLTQHRLRTIFRGKLYTLEGMGALQKTGHKAYRWTVKPGWEAIVEGNFGLQPRPLPTPTGEGTPVDTAELQKLRQQFENLQVATADLCKQNDELKQQVQEAKKVQTVRIELHKNGKVRKLDPKKRHVQFPRVMQLCAARKHVLLVGPAGCGKSFLAKQVQEALESPRFGQINCSVGMSEGQLTGRLLPTGKAGTFEFTPAEFQMCYEQGGLFLLDEIDAADPNTMVVLNAALAGDELPLPNRPSDPVAKRHSDFVLIAAANTYGKGSDRQYVGRNELDEATLDRFRIGIVEIDYDRDLETQLCPNDEFRGKMWNYRDRIQQNRLERILSTRFLIDACDMLEHGWTIEDVETSFFAGWSPDELKKVRC